MPRKKANPLALKERDVAKQIRDFLELRRWRRVRMNAIRMPGVSSEMGAPDELWIRYNTLDLGIVDLFWLETKAPGRTPSVAQLEWHTREKIRGAMVCVADSFPSFHNWYTENWSI